MNPAATPKETPIMKLIIIISLIALAVYIMPPVWSQIERIYRFWIWIDAENMNDPYRRAVRRKSH